MKIIVLVASFEALSQLTLLGIYSPFCREVSQSRLLDVPALFDRPHAIMMTVSQTSINMWADTMASCFATAPFCCHVVGLVKIPILFAFLTGVMIQ